MGGKSGGVLGYKYYMGLHMGLCRGPVDEIVAIKVGDRGAWPESSQPSTVPAPADPFIEGTILTTIYTLEDLSPLSPGTNFRILIYTDTTTPQFSVGKTVTFTGFVRQIDSAPLGGPGVQTIDASGTYTITALDFGAAPGSKYFAIAGGTLTFQQWYYFISGDNVSSPGLWHAEVPPDPPPSGSVVGNGYPADMSKQIYINAPDLFGGDSKEGGVQGVADVMMGEDTQGANASLMAVLGATTLSAFRGMCTVFYKGLIATNNPYPKPWSFRVRRTTKGWDGAVFHPTKATITIPSPLAGQPVPTLTLYENIDYGGESTVYTNSVLDLGPGATHLNDFYSSAKVENGDWKVYKDANFAGEELTLTVGDYPTLAPSGFNDAISSLRPVRAVATEDLEIKAANPAHIVYEVLTNREWGRGFPTSILDLASFIDAADKLYAEGFGLCMRWSRSGDTLPSFLQSVIDHANMVLFRHPATNLYTLWLIRDDYDVNTLVTASTSNFILSITDDQETASQGLVNEMVVKYTDPVTNEIRQARAQNIALLQSTGSILSKSVEYLGIPSAALAARVAQRDLKANGTPLRRFTMRVNRRGWQAVPGTVFKLHDPSRGIDSMILRIVEMTDAAAANGEITVKCIQDMYGLASTSYVTPQLPNTPAYNPNGPQVAKYSDAFEAGYIDVVRALTPTELAAVAPDTAYLYVLAARPTSVSVNYQVYSGLPGALANRGTGAFSPAGKIGAIIAADGGVHLTGAVDEANILPGMLGRIGNEYVKVLFYDAPNSMVHIDRGCADTIPADHAANTIFWAYDSTVGFDPSVYVPTDVVVGKALTVTATSTLAQSLADNDMATMVGRFSRPYPPGKVEFNGTYAYLVTTLTLPLTATWAHRNRVTQGDTLVSHTDASVTPEVGTTYTFQVWNAAGTTMLRETTLISGTTAGYSLQNWVDDGAPSQLMFKLFSVLDGRESWQKYSFVKDVVPSGWWGLMWGTHWG